MISSSQKKILKIVGYPLFFIFCFLFFLSLTFPTERLIPIVEAKLSSMLGRQVWVDELSISPLGNISLSNVKIEVPLDESAKPTDDEDNPQPATSTKKSGDSGKEAADDNETAKKKIKPKQLKYIIEELNIDVSFASLLVGDLDVQMDMDFLGGRLNVAYAGPLASGKSSAQKPKPISRPQPGRGPKTRMPGRSPRGKLAAPGQAPDNAEEETMDEDAEQESDEEEPKGLTLSVDAQGVELGKFLDLRQSLPLPLFGTVDFKMDIKTSTGSFEDANGRIQLDGAKLSLGRGRSKLELIDGMDPLTVDAVKISKLNLDVQIKEGVAEIKKIKVQSNDFDGFIEGDITFAEPFAASRLNLYFAFKLLQGYADKSENAKNLMSMLDLVPVLTRAKRTDDYYGFTYRGRFKTAKFQPSKIFRGSNRNRSTRATARNTRRTSTRRSTTGTAAARKSGATIPPKPSTVKPPENPAVVSPVDAEEPDAPSVREIEVKGPEFIREPEPPDSRANLEGEEEEVDVVVHEDEVHEEEGAEHDEGASEEEAPSEEGEESSAEDENEEGTSEGESGQEEADGEDE